jgi:hypothetical protein
VRSPSGARAWCSCRREHTLLCRRDVGSDSSHSRSKLVVPHGEQSRRGELGSMAPALPTDLKNLPSDRISTEFHESHPQGRSPGPSAIPNRAHARGFLAIL